MPMWYRLLSILAGLLVGASLGGAAAYLLAPAAPSDTRWATYPALADATPAPQGPVLWQHTRSAPEFQYWLFLGVLLGGGFGAVTGAVASLGGFTPAEQPKPRE